MDDNNDDGFEELRRFLAALDVGELQDEAVEEVLNELLDLPGLLLPLLAGLGNDPQLRGRMIKNWSHVTCSNFHRLKYKGKTKSGWACDAATLGLEDANLRERDARRKDRLSKYRYGIGEDEEWTCVRGCTNFNQLDNVKHYACKICDFDLCDLCYERAAKSIDRLKQVNRLVNNNEKGEKVAWLQAKLMVVGEGGSGKTSTVRTLLGLGYKPEWDSTVGASIRYAHVASGEKWKEVEADKQAEFATRAAASIPTVTNELSFEHNQREKFSPLEWLKSKLPKTQNRQMREYYRELEKERQQERLAPGEEVAKDQAVMIGSINLEMLENSFKESGGIKFTIWDYGGQKVFYSLHHLFLTQYGVYLIVFNCMELLDDSKDESIDFLQFWFNSIHMHAPITPVILIGTHIDYLEKPLEETAIINKLLQPLCEPFEQLAKVPDGLYLPLNNVTGAGSAELKSLIQESCQKQEFLNLQVKMSWLKCLDKMNADTSKLYLSLTEVKHMAEELEIQTGSELDSMLRLFHELGVIIHFSSTVALQQIVVINAQWLIDELGKLIRDVNLHGYEEEVMETAGLVEDYHRLYTEGIASRDMLNFFWQSKQVEFFIDLLRRALLLSDWAYGDGQDTYYLVPSLLPVSTSSQQRNSGSTPICKFDFSSSFLPDGVFERLVCLCIDYCASKGDTSAPEITGTSAILSFDTSEKLQLWKESTCIVCVTQVEASKGVSIVGRMLRKVNEDVMGSGMEWSLLYETPEGAFVGDKKARAFQLKPWFAETAVESSNDHVKGLDLDNFILSL